jgi:hypothetical protein
LPGYSENREAICEKQKRPLCVSGPLKKLASKKVKKNLFLSVFGGCFLANNVVRDAVHAYQQSRYENEGKCDRIGLNYIFK